MSTVVDTYLPPVIRKTQPHLVGDIMKYYSHRVWCSNCRYEQLLYIRRGVRMTGLGYECSGCGCEEKL